MDNEDIVREIALVSDFKDINKLRCVSVGLYRILNKILTDGFWEEYAKIHYGFVSVEKRDWKTIVYSCECLLRSEEYIISYGYNIVLITIAQINDKNLILEDLISGRAYELLDVTMENGIFKEMEKEIIIQIIDTNDDKIAKIMAKYIKFDISYAPSLDKSDINPELLRIILQGSGDELTQDTKDMLTEEYRYNKNKAAKNIMLEFGGKLRTFTINHTGFEYF